jgi:signal transduction histidine kinase
VAIVFGGWTAYAFVAAYIFYAWRSRTGQQHPPYLGMVHFWLVTCWLWALLTLPIVAAARRFPVTAANWPVRIPLHLGFALVTHVVQNVVLWAIHPHVRPGPRPEMPESLFGTLILDLFVYSAIVAAVHARDAQRQAFRLRTELVEAELHLMRMQLQPHFLFNALNAVSELIHIDPARAERALARLADLLRWSLQSARLREVPLREELAALDNYLDIQRMRHGEQLTFRVDPAPDTLGLAVPSLLLQPLVENAILHGIRGLPAGTVAIRARRDGDRLELEVSDDGRGIAASFREGTGLRTTRARLAGLYGADQRVHIAAGERGGTVVGIELPARAATSADGAATT